jgi:hypothetical protein
MDVDTPLTLRADVETALGGQAREETSGFRDPAPGDPSSIECPGNPAELSSLRALAALV